MNIQIPVNSTSFKLGCNESCFDVILSHTRNVFSECNKVSVKKYEGDIFLYYYEFL